MSGWPGTIIEVVAWWAACLGLWLLSLSAVPAAELLVATLVSLPCGVLAVAGRRAAKSRWRFDPRRLAAAPLLPLAILSDTLVVLVSVLPGHRRSGRFNRFAMSDSTGDGARANGRRAVATLLVSATPASLTADIDASSGVALIHVVPGPGPRMHELATR